MIFTILISILFFLDILFTYIIMKQKEKFSSHMWILEQNEFANSCWEKYGLKKGTIIAGLYGFLILIIFVFSIEHFPFFHGNIIVNIIRYFFIFCFFILYYSTIFNHLKIMSIMKRISKNDRK